MNKNNSLSEDQKIFYRRTKMIAIQKQPYIAAAINRMVPVDSPGLSTAGVDKHWRVYIDFHYFIDKGYNYAAGVLSHEVWHLLRDHASREEKVNANSKEEKDIWNIAADLEINDDIVNIIPDDALIPGVGKYSKLKTGLSAEEYYHILLKDAKSNSSSSSSNSSSDGANSNEDDNPRCGSGSGGNTFEQEQSSSEPDGLSEVAIQGITKSVAKSIQESKAKGYDSLSESLEIWAEEVLDHKPADWKKLLLTNLKNVFRSVQGYEDYSKSHPARRQVIEGILLPGRRSPAPKIAIGIDTSYSNVEKLGVISNEIDTLIKKTGIRGKDLILFNVDSVIQGKPTYINSIKDISYVGSGGTDLNKAFDYVSEKLYNQIDMFILLTDGEYEEFYTQRPNRTSRIKFIVCLIVDSVNDRNNAMNVIRNAEEKLSKWAQLVIIDLGKIII